MPFLLAACMFPVVPPNYPIPQPKAASALKRLFHPTHLSGLPLDTTRDGELLLSRASFCRPYNLCGNYSTLPLWLEVTRDNTKTMEYGYAPIKLSFQKQAVGRWV